MGNAVLPSNLERVMSTIRIEAAQYADHDDCLAAAASDYAEQHFLQDWDLDPRYEDQRNRDVILLTVPDAN
jgi:hypothetical protein